MNRKINLLLLPIFTMIFSSCGEAKECEHVDLNNDGICDTCSERIKDPCVLDVMITPASLRLNIGEFGHLSAFVNAMYGASNEVIWSSSNENIASVSNDGLVTAISEGDTLIYATSVFDSTKRASCSVRIIDPNSGTKAVVDNVSVSPKTASVDVGKTVNLYATVTGSGDFSTDVIWKSSNEEIATVINGAVYGVSEGKVIITATSVQDQTKFDAAEVTINKVEEVDKELKKFNSLVTEIKTKHNYELEISSEVEGYEESDNYYDHIISFNDKAIQSKDFEIGFDYSGIIYHKDQGYVKYFRDGDNIYTDKFISTNKELRISDFYEVLAENLFIGNYTQDSVDKTKFTTTSIDSIAVGCYFTGYGDYIYTGVLTAPNSLSVFVDDTNDTLTLKMDYWLRYFDVVEVQDHGVLTILIKNIGKISDSIIDNYIDNPTSVYKAPTEWNDSEKEIFDSRFNSYYPVMPVGITYAYSLEEDIVDGYYHAVLIDRDSGDLRETYGQALLGEGFTKVNNSKYTKEEKKDGEFETSKYSIQMTYEAPSLYFPNGVMTIAYRGTKSVSGFSTIEDFNSYLGLNDYDELVPTLPLEDTCTGITNFKNTTDTDPTTYALKVNLTDTFKVYIPTYSKAKTFVDSYVRLLIAKGFSEKSSFFSMSNYSYAESRSGSYVAIDFSSTEVGYSGYIGIRYVIYKDDEQSLRNN